MIVFTATCLSVSAGSSHPKHTKNSMISKCPYGHCAALVENGRCDKCAVTNNPYCTQHGKPVTYKKATTKK